MLHNLDHFETVHFEPEGGMPILRGDEVVKRPAVPAEMTGLYTAEALNFIEAHREQPFFLYLAHAMPHIPFDASPRFKGKSGRGLYGDCVEELDWSTGEILARLRALGLAEKTLVLFTSDNGPERNTPGTAAPLSGTKHTVFEGGLRVPCLAWWPGKVPASRVCDEFITTLEVLPTFAHLAGAQLPKAITLDGFDVSRVLLGETGARSPRTTLYSLYGGARSQSRKESLREGHWKLHLGTPPTLFDLNTDPAERTDVAPQNAEAIRRLERLAVDTRIATLPAPTKP